MPPLPASERGQSVAPPGHATSNHAFVVLVRLFFSASLGLCAYSSLPATAAAQSEVSDQARALFKERVEALSAEIPDHQKAYDAFSRTYEGSPSWKILGNLGIAAMKLERDGEAIEAFNQYLGEGRPFLSASDIAQFEADVELLKREVS